MLMMEDVNAEKLDETTTPAAPAEPSAEGEEAALDSKGLPKNFRQQADIEAFYRFVNENDLREEALTILDQTRQASAAAKTAKARIKH